MDIPAKWYEDWHNARHALVFDGRSTLTREGLVRDYESFNDVRLLKGCLDRSLPVTLLEVGCATGEFYRYLQVAFPRVRYYGMDLSRSAIARAKAKYPEGHFLLSNPHGNLEEAWGTLGIPDPPQIVYAKDVLHHQSKPWDFLRSLLALPAEALILRTRTRDVGQTVLDPELSCQYHYKGWMPYLVFNLQELIARMQAQVPASEIVVLKNPMILGGRENRFLPKECYLPETGTAETAIGVFLRTGRPAAVRIEDRPDRDLTYPLGYRLRNFVQRWVEKRSVPCASE